MFLLEHMNTGAFFMGKRYDVKLHVAGQPPLDKRNADVHRQIEIERACLLKALSGGHPGIVKFYHCFREEHMGGASASVFLLLDYTRTWRELWRMIVVPRSEETPGEQRFLPIGIPESEARYLFEQAVSAVSALHKLGYVHRDVPRDQPNLHLIRSSPSRRPAREHDGFGRDWATPHRRLDSHSGCFRAHMEWLDSGKRGRPDSVGCRLHVPRNGRSGGPSRGGRRDGV